MLIPRWPLLPPAVRSREADELASLVQNPPKLPEELVNRYKPAPAGFAPNFEHLTNCTVCENDRRWRSSVHAAPLQLAPGSPQLLLDEAPLTDWDGVVLELETPRKRRVSFVDPTHSTAEPARSSRVKHHVGTGMPGTVLYEGGRFRAWVDQFQQTHHESQDGVRFQQKPGALKWLPAAKPSAGAAGLDGNYRRAAKLLGRQPVAQSTFTLMRDDDAPAAERYKAAFNCLVDRRAHNPLGHSPRSLSKAVRRQLSRRVDGLGWQSTCLAHSADGLGWRPYELQHEKGKGPPPLRMASDTSNSIFYDERRRAHIVVNRWNAPLPEGSYGTPLHNPNWWREIRGVRISSNAQLRVGGGGTPREWREEAEWYFDREGKNEHMRRQVYSLQVGAISRTGLFVGLLNVIEWGKLPEAAAEPPFRRDVMRTYLATSRDGVSYDTSWVYEQQELVPHGECRRKPGCATVPELELHMPHAMVDGGWREYDLLCCPFDHAQVVPASSLTTAHGAHMLYYEGRYYPHEKRFQHQPTGLGVAVWREHRLGGVRRDPRLPTGRCGSVVSKPVTRQLLRAAAAAGARGEAHVRLNARAIGASSHIRAELVVGCRPGRVHRSVNERNFVPVRGDHTDAPLLWRSRRTLALAAAAARKRRDVLRLRFHLCGDAKLFAFTIHSGPPPALASTGPLPPQPPQPPPEPKTSSAYEAAVVEEAAATRARETARRVQVEQALKWRALRGGCAVAAKQVRSLFRPYGDCETGSRGATSMLNEQLSTVDGCVLHCALCARCQYVTLSLGAPHWGCAWFTTCDTSHMRPLASSIGANLSADLDGTQLTIWLDPARRPSLRAQYERSVDGQLMAHASAGFCGLTSDADPGNCSAPNSKGAYLAIHRVGGLRDCLRVCEGCASCNFVSWSLADNDCSWYSHCTFDRLQRVPVTQHVSLRLHDPGVQRLLLL